MKRIFKACKYSVAGLIEACKHEAAFRQELLLVMVGAVALGMLDLSGALKCLLGFSLVLILIVELINTAIENIVDRIGTEYNLLSKRAKDVGSAAVFLTILSVVALWICVLFVI